MIEVILLEKIERLGNMGSVVKVKPGYARNFLLPQKKALRATKANLELFEKQRAELEARNAHMRAEAEKKAGKIEGIKVIIVRQASETGQLYGSVSARDIAEAAKEAGHEIERSSVQIETPIKAIGLYPVKIKLHAEVYARMTVNVARSPEEAIVQEEKEATLAKAAAERAKAEAEKASVESAGTEKGAKKKGKTAGAKKAAEQDVTSAESAPGEQKASRKTGKPGAKKTAAKKSE